MNPKDKNIFKGLAFLVVVCGLVVYAGLKVFGEPLRLVGALATGYAGLRLLVTCYKSFVKAPVDPATFGQWAVVTGCTGGLGQEFARRIAKKGMNLILVSRSQSKLETLQAELKATYGVDVLVLAFDFAQCSRDAEAAFYGHQLPALVAASPVHGDVGLLVNNVGVGDAAPYAVDEMKVTDVADMIKVNCGAIVNMSRCLLPLFKHRQGGAIVNVSSGSCAQPSPYLATYASTKAFDLHFSQSCSREGAAHGIVVLGIRPYYVSGTGLYPSAKPSLNAPAAATVVAGAFHHLGRYEVSHAYWLHGVLGWLFGTLFEDPVAAPVIARLAKRAGVNGTMLAIQQAARARSQAKLAATWAPVEAAAQEHLRRLGCVK